jgi:hypothetical protein
MGGKGTRDGLGLALTLLYRRNLCISDANRRVPAERQAYDALQSSLAAVNLAAVSAYLATSCTEATWPRRRRCGVAHTLFPKLTNAASSSEKEHRRAPLRNA